LIITILLANGMAPLMCFIIVITEYFCTNFYQEGVGSTPAVVWNFILKIIWEFELNKHYYYYIKFSSLISLIFLSIFQY
jgi:hypothetical protein